MAEEGSPVSPGGSGEDVIALLKFKKLADMVVDRAFSQCEAHQNQSDDRTHEQEIATLFSPKFRAIQDVLAQQHPA